MQAVPDAVADPAIRNTVSAVVVGVAIEKTRRTRPRETISFITVTVSLSVTQPFWHNARAVRARQHSRKWTVAISLQLTHEYLKEIKCENNLKATFIHTDFLKIQITHFTFFLPAV